MPRYDYECATCSRVEERLLPYEQSNLPQACNKCGGPLEKVFLRAPAGFVSNAYSPYTCPITGEVISGKRAHEENLKKHGCRVLEAGEKEAAAKFRADCDAALDRGVEETVEREIALMPGDKKERLANELAAGVEAVVERK